jgi:ABC-type proline/glycine betaine transport system permease subunit
VLLELLPVDVPAEVADVHAVVLPGGVEVRALLAALLLAVAHVVRLTVLHSKKKKRPQGGK